MLFRTQFACAVVLDGKVYVGGGYTDIGDDEFIIQVYAPENDEWSLLPICPVRWFALAILNQQLIVVGGYAHKCVQSVVMVWDHTSKSWTRPFPNLPTARRSPSAVGYQQFLVVAGGHCGSYLTAVEVLNSSTKQWYTTTPLPACSDPTPVVVGDTLHLLGGWSGTTSPNNRMLSIYLPALISFATSTPQPPPPVWEATETNFTFSAAVSRNNYLLAVGGKDERNRRSSSIHLYSSLNKQWTKVGDLPVVLSECSSAVLSSGQLVVLGGVGNDGRRCGDIYFGTFSHLQ